jgi:hypothetical protein
MKTTEKRIVVTLMASILLAGTLSLATAARQANAKNDPKAPNTSQKSIAVTTPEQPLTSIYIDLHKQCRTLQEPTDTNLTLLWRCAGVADHKLLLEWDDGALTAKIVTPRGRKFDLGMSELFTEHKPYVDLGSKTEWRVKQEHGTVVPVALIVRVDPSIDLFTHEPSFLAVAKITKQQICITDRIAPGSRENEEARRAADGAAYKPCLKAGE